MSSDAVVKSVGNKLRYYFEVKRLEEGFDLSGVNQPILDHPRLRPRKTLQCNVLKDVPLKHHFKSPNIRVKLTQFPGVHAPGSPRERKVKRVLERCITRSEFVGVTIRTTKDRKRPYTSDYSYIQTSRGRKLRPEASGLCTITRSRRKKDRSVKGAVPVLRSAPPHFVTKKQADRLITVASKILVANETIDYKEQKTKHGNETNSQSAPSPFETERQLPSVEVEQRPKTSRGFHRKTRMIDDPGRDSAYTTDRTSPGSDEYHRIRHSDGSTGSRSSKSSDSETEHSPRPPAGGRPSNRHRTRPSSARTLHQNQIMDISHPPGGQVGIELGVQTRGNVAIQTDSRGDLEERFLKEGDHLVTAGPPVDYVIYVRTGNRIGASTKAQVKLTLYGEHGRSQEFLLNNSQRHKIKFQKGHEDLFAIRSQHVGRLKCVKIGHDRPELMFAWFLEGVTVEDSADKRVYECPCERWLSGQDGDKRTYRLLFVDRDRALIEDSEDDSGSDVSYIKKYGEDTESEKEDGLQNSPDTVRGRRSIRSSNSDSGSETESETDTETSSSVSSDTPREARIPVSATNTDVKVTQTVQSKPRLEESTIQVSPGRKQKDDFFDQRPAGPTYTFRTGTSVGSQEEADTEKPELSLTETDSETSKTTSESTEAINKAAIVLPKSTFPVIAEEDPKRYPTSATSQEREVVHEEEKEAPLDRIVPRIAVEPVVEPEQPRGTYFSQHGGAIEEENSEDLEESSSEASTERRESVNVADDNKGATDEQIEGALAVKKPTSTGTVDEMTETGSSTDRTTTTTKSGSATNTATSKSNSGANTSTTTTTHSGSETERSTTTSGSSTGRSTTLAETGAVGTKRDENIKTQSESKRADSGTEDSDSDSSSSGSSSDSGSDYDSEEDTPRPQQPTEAAEQNIIGNNDNEITNSGDTESGETLHEAAKSGNLEMVKRIIEAHPERKSDLNEVGWTALHVAAAEGQVEVVRWLGRNGDNLNTETPTGYSAIHLAALHGHGNTIMALSSLGATINCQTTDHQTPLHLAALSGHLESVKWLIANGVDIGIKDDSGRTALDLAAENEHDHVAEYLRLCADDSHTQLNTDRDRMNDLPLADDGIRPQKDARETFKPDDSKTDEEDLEEKRQLYEEQQNKMNKSGLSFLDSIRQELDS